MADSKAAPEPSMEEILSSIRRIIAEDETSGQSATPDRPTDDEEEDVLELTEMVSDSEPPEPLSAAAKGEPPMAPVSPSPPTQEKPAMPVEISEPLVSSSAAAASTNAFARLAKAAAPDERRATPVAEITVEQLIVDLLTPMLRDWLDQNLPAIVERVVEQEVKKLARRAELT
jgi:cell pole-organizing protein PopZ